LPAAQIICYNKSKFLLAKDELPKLVFGVKDFGSIKGRQRKAGVFFIAKFNNL
jgi:hypothetical protein